MRFLGKFAAMVVMAVAGWPTACAGAKADLDQPAEKAAAKPTSAEPGVSTEVAATLSRGRASFLQGASSELEVKRAPTGHLLVRPAINGIKAGWFIFDTGAGICVVSTPHASEFSLDSAGEIDSTGVGGHVKNKLYRAKRMQVGPLVLEDHAIMATDLSFLKPFLQEDIAGVLGYGVFKESIVEMSLATPRILIHDPAKFELPKGATWTELSLDGRIPAVKATFEGHEGLFRIDTGANGMVTFHEPAVKKWKLLEGRETSDAKLGGVGGFVKARRGAVEWFELGGLRQEKITAEFAIEAKGTFAESSKDGNIGADMLKRFTLFFEYGKGRVAFVPHKEGENEPEKKEPKE